LKKTVTEIVESLKKLQNEKVPKLILDFTSNIIGFPSQIAVNLKT
jgi:hypothetical protein